MFDRLHVYAETDRRGAALNMAIDEALLENATDPILRYYGWARPALSFGYFGRFADLASITDREIVRRWTGGGIVPHGEDLTYSIVIPANHPAFRASSVQIYHALHTALLQALRTGGMEVDLADGPATTVSEHCFANPVRADVMSGGTKIAGAAHRRTRRGLLHQGSIQRQDLPPDFPRWFAQALTGDARWLQVDRALIRRAGELADQKYGSRVWLERR